MGLVSNQPRSKQVQNIVPKLPQVAFVNEKYDKVFYDNQADLNNRVDPARKKERSQSKN